MQMGISVGSWTDGLERRREQELQHQTHVHGENWDGEAKGSYESLSPLKGYWGRLGGEKRG